MRHEDRKAKKAITDVKFAPSGGCFALASEDGRVYIHDASDYALRTVCSKTTTAVKTLDWSLDSKYVCGVTKGLDLVYLDAASGKPLTTPALVRDAAWATATVPVGFNAQGLWPEDSAVDIQTVDRSASEKLIAKVCAPPPCLHSAFSSMHPRLFLLRPTPAFALCSPFNCGLFALFFCVFFLFLL